MPMARVRKRAAARRFRSARVRFDKEPSPSLGRINSQ